jgi:hypothetical protein
MTSAGNTYTSFRNNKHNLLTIAITSIIYHVLYVHESPSIELESLQVGRETRLKAQPDESATLRYLIAQPAESSMSRAVVFGDIRKLRQENEILICGLPHDGDYSGVDGVVSTRYISNSLTPSASAMVLATPNQVGSNPNMATTIGILARIVNNRPIRLPA